MERGSRMGLSWKRAARSILVIVLSELLILLPAVPAGSQREAQTETRLPLHAYLLKSYMELFELAPELHFSPEEIRAEREALEKGRSSCQDRYRDLEKQYDRQIEQAQRELREQGSRLSSDRRHELHCTIQNLRDQKGQADVLAAHAIPVAYENMQAKLDLIQNWPEDYRKIRQELADGSYRKRRWGDVEDIGFRNIAPGQKDDIKTGEEAIKQLKQQGLWPKEIENKQIVDYVNEVAQRVARHSDLQVPLHVYVLDSKEINASALPGGFLLVERGLLEAADDESELAGVLGHEIGHVVARHGHKLMKRATIASIIYQAAQIDAIMLTGGVASIGTYYALQYGFYGLGLVLDLRLLGISREYELEADQLGIQYTWNAGYDPSGFIRFFDKMASKEGYVRGIGWFRTHPPFYQRMVDAEREILFLPKKPNAVVQTSAFEQMKKALAPIVQHSEQEAKERPSLIATEPNCPAPQKLYQEGENIEQLCQKVPQAGKQP